MKSNKAEVKMGRPTKRPEPDFLLALYAKHKAKEIAYMYGVSESTVRSWISRIKKERMNMENE